MVALGVKYQVNKIRQSRFLLIVFVACERRNVIRRSRTSTYQFIIIATIISTIIATTSTASCTDCTTIDTSASSTDETIIAIDCIIIVVVVVIETQLKEQENEP